MALSMLSANQGAEEGAGMPCPWLCHRLRFWILPEARWALPKLHDCADLKLLCAMLIQPQAWMQSQLLGLVLRPSITKPHSSESPSRKPQNPGRWPLWNPGARPRAGGTQAADRRRGPGPAFQSDAHDFSLFSLTAAHNARKV